jgi:hypothetical protein
LSDDPVVKLVVLALTDKLGLQMVYRYVVLNDRPSDIASTLKISKYVVRGIVFRYGDGVAEVIAKHFRKLYELPLAYEVIKGRFRRLYVCRLCGKHLRTINSVKHHIHNSHLDYIHSLINDLGLGVYVGNSRHLRVHTHG